MRSVYRALAYIVAAEVAVQAMAIVLAVAGLGRWWRLAEFSTSR
ncbi:MAG TPA: hypothetical protein VHN80_14885 [Kineosporiaceae bacterium]|jgi:hypothetical protein|nr:hypothetical protein [Kineosporiaceae bacterium]